ncbi:MAG TPA: phosphatase domain-containing protein [Anaerolineae bacterium]
MMSWQRALALVASSVERHFDALKSRLDNRLGGAEATKIVPYRGYGTPRKLYLKGRVLKDQGMTAAGDNDSLWNNLLNIYRRLESDEVPYARLWARFQDGAQEVAAGPEGYFELWLESTHSLDESLLWHEVDLELLEPLPEKGEPVRATGQVLVPSSRARFAVVSDIDDTVILTHATQLLRMARTVFLGNARTRLPFPGVAAFYRALQAGTEAEVANPLFYVSSSPWNLYDLLMEFFELQGIPVAPTFLRDWGVSEHELLPTGHREHKLALIRQLLDVYDQLPFILIGDSGQEDPEIYHEVVHQYPERILAVYIRNVSPDLERPKAISALAEEVVAAGSTLILADDTLVMAQHAAAQGWIDAGALPAIEREKEQDEAPASPLEAMLGEEIKEEGPTVIVEVDENSEEI